jgi:hypothetical protein
MGAQGLARDWLVRSAHMQAVAILALGSPVDAEIPALARDLGVTAFEAGQLLRGIFPSVVLKTDDGARATRLAQALDSRRHRTLVFELGDVVRHSAMFSPKSFVLEATAITALGTGDEKRSLSFAGLRALIRATHAAQVDAVQIDKGRAFSPGRALLSGGIVVTKAIEKETRTRTVEKEPVLYVFSEATPPWLLCESSLKYDGLGPKLKPGRSENFLTLARILKEAAPQAFFDERLLQFRGAQLSPNTPDTLDLLAHLLAKLALP